MPVCRANPCRVKLHRSYTVPELAACLAVHKNTIRNWQREGLEPVNRSRPILFDGAIHPRVPDDAHQGPQARHPLRYRLRLLERAQSLLPCSHGQA